MTNHGSEYRMGLMMAMVNHGFLYDNLWCLKFIDDLNDDGCQLWMTQTICVWWILVLVLCWKNNPQEMCGSFPILNHRTSHGFSYNHHRCYYQNADPDQLEQHWRCMLAASSCDSLASRMLWHPGLAEGMGLPGPSEGRRKYSGWDTQILQN